MAGKLVSGTAAYLRRRTAIQKNRDAETDGRNDVFKWTTEGILGGRATL